jgi:hypothetical protein
MKTSLILMTMAAGAMFGADVVEMRHPAEPKSAVESGRVGTKTRPAPQQFSGKPLMPMVSRRSGDRPVIYMATQQTVSGATNNVVTIKSPARFTKLQAGTAKTVTAGKKATAKAAAFDPFDPRAQMIDPQDGSTLAPTQIFEWSAGDGATDYYMWIGSCYECADLLNEDEGQNQVRTVPLPVDGRMIYVALFSWIGGEWYEIDYQYQAAMGQQAVAAQMTAPVNGSTLGSPQTFQWDSGYGVSGYFLQVGSCEGCNDLYNANEGSNLADSVSIPIDGRTIYARLFSLIGNNWYYYDYQYRAPQASNLANVRVNIANPFAYPVNVSINGEVVGSVPPFTTAGTNVIVNFLSVSFEVVQPTLNGNALGDTMAGIFSTIVNPSGTYLFQLSNQIGNSFYFLPVITNQTSQPLAMEVNGGLTAENRCGCEVPANTADVAAGYYLLFSNSNVRLYQVSANYSGAYEYFGTDATPLYTLITDASAEVSLTVNRLP